MTTTNLNLTLGRVTDPNQAQVDLENAGMVILAWEHDPQTGIMKVFTPWGASDAQRLALRVGYQPATITFRGPLR